MNVFARPTQPARSRDSFTPVVAVIFAAVLVVMVVAQLFTFEDFSELFLSFNIPLTLAATVLLAPLIVATELFALPFLLRMTVSRAFRWVSMVCGWIVAIIWIGLSLWAQLNQPDIANLGMLGSIFDIPAGWQATVIALLLICISGLVSWRMWPGDGRRSIKRS